VFVDVKLAKDWELTSNEIAKRRGGGALYQHEIRWAHQDLAREGVIERKEISGRGRWKLRTKVVVVPEDYDRESATFFEGATINLSVNAYERNKEARELCLKTYGASCRVCEFDFEREYGPVGKDCIHIHHIVELSSIGTTYEVDPVRDLAPVCPNCHYIIHRRRPAYTIEEVREMLKSAH
jgi:5-methylcytosine-specific restriction protein A